MRLATWSFVCMAACGGSDGKPEDTDVPVDPPDTDVPADTGDTDPADTGARPAGEGNIGVVTLVWEEGATTAQAGFFVPETGYTVNPEPPEELHGCSIRPVSPDPGTADLPFVGAGAVALLVGDDVVPLPGDGTDWYEAELPEWPGGELIGVTATGGRFGAFDLPGLLPAPDLVETAPLPATLDRSQDLVFTWTPGSAGMIARLANDLLLVDCPLQDAAGTWTLHADVLGRLGAGPARVGLGRYFNTVQHLPGGELLVVAAEASTMTEITLE